MLSLLPTNVSLKHFQPASVLLLSFMLTACGGGAGDDDTNDVPAAIPGAAIEPLVGTWNLPGNWSGEQNDIAYLLIRQPDSNGEADALIYDFDDASTGLGRNCYSVDGLTGSVTESLTNELFLDLTAFPDAIVSLDAGDNLIVEYTDGVSSATNRQTITLVAERVVITETDITPLCDG